jgi:fido (protein-threonine AMPylation protein)
MDLIAKAHDITVEPLRAFDPLATGEIIDDSIDASILANITPAIILFTHRLVCFELPPRLIGRLRRDQIYIQKAAAAPGEPTLAPPPPAEVSDLLDKLCARWRAGYGGLVTTDNKLDAIAGFFHGLIFIHPFIDGNGRVARSLLMQQCIELFGHVDMSRFNRGVEYYAALQAADGSLPSEWSRTLLATSAADSFARRANVGGLPSLRKNSDLPLTSSNRERKYEISAERFHDLASAVWEAKCADHLTDRDSWSPVPAHRQGRLTFEYKGAPIRSTTDRGGPVVRRKPFDCSLVYS